MTDIFYVDGVYQAHQPAQIPVTDLGILRGYGVFDFTRTYHKHAWMLAEHIERLFESAQSIEIDIPHTQQEVIAIVEEAIRRSTHPDCDIRILLTAGDGLNTLTPMDTPRLVVMVTAVSVYSADDYRDGIRAITVNEPRYLPGVKSLNYIPAMLALKKARAAGATEAIYTDSDGLVYEGTTNNLFIVERGIVRTAPLVGVLRGITRDVVLELARTQYPVEVDSFTVERLYHADEVFITSSSKQIMPVTRVDDAIIGDGKAGPYTQNLMACFDSLVEQTRITQR
jgi:branched-chain amino acid aminotransferase